MENLFEFELCHECGGDTDHHTVTPAVFGLPFAWCRFPRDDAGIIHPTITAYHEENNTPCPP